MPRVSWCFQNSLVACVEWSATDRKRHFVEFSKQGRGHELWMKHWGVV
jgi:hypothetical protein